MDQGIRDILKVHYHEMMGTITEPNLLAPTISVLTPVDVERIQAETRERGPATGVFELLNRLQKRGSQAFPQLIEALRTNHRELAKKLETLAISRNLHRPIRQTSHDATPGHDIPVARGPWPSQRPPQAERSLSSPVQPASALSHQESTEEMHGSQSAPELLTDIDIPRPEDLTPHEEEKSQQPKNKGKETLLKDIPSRLKDKVVNMLSIEDALGKDWKGIAAGLQLTAEQQGQIKSCSKTSPMEELFNQMLHKGYRVIDLINMLKKIDRQDVIGEISVAGYYPQDLEGGEGVQSPTQVDDGSAAKNDFTMEEKRDEVSPVASPLSPTEKGKKRDASSPVAGPLSPTDSTMEEKKKNAINPVASPLSPTTPEFDSDNSTVKELDEKKEEKEEAKCSTTGLPSPTEVSVFGADNFTKEKTNKKKGSSIAGRPSETEDAELGSDKEAGASSCVKNLPSPTQVSQSGSLDDSSTKPDKKKQEHLSQEVEDAKREEEDENEPLTDRTPFEEEVFFPDTIQAKAVFITCEKYQKMNKLTQLNQQIKKLSRELEDGNWESIPLKDYTSAKMKSELDLKLHNLSQSDVCFVYLAGHTLQINGENYFLPIDVELNLSAADIMDTCLNINSLVKELSERALMALVIVDGGHYNEEKFECQFALPGLASIIPPSKTVIAFPCQPGYIRPQEEALLYLKALINVIKEKKHLVLTDLFDSVREVLKDSQSLPVEFSLSSSLLPIYLNTSEEDEEGITVRKPDDNTPRHAIVFCDYSLDKLHGDKTTVKTTAEHLVFSLNQLGWTVETCTNLKPDKIKRKIRQSLKGLQDMNVFMLYFIGYVTKDKHSIGQESWENDAHAQKLPIQWLVNMMSEYVTGPKILVVDDPSVPVRELSPMTALPQEVLCCLPNGNRERSREEQTDSFTLLFAQNLATSGPYTLKTVITTTARKWKYHRVDSKLFYA